MLIYVDDNELLHSSTLVKALGDVALPMNLDSGDYLMYANGIKGNGVGGTAAVEHKRGVDLAGCVLFTNRHLDQLDRMGKLYDEVILLISQKIVPDEDGLAATPIKGQGLVPLTPAHSTQTISYKRYDKHLRTIERCMGVRVIETDGLKHAATRLLNLAEGNNNTVTSAQFNASISNRKCSSDLGCQSAALYLLTSHCSHSLLISCHANPLLPGRGFLKSYTSWLLSRSSLTISGCCLLCQDEATYILCVVIIYSPALFKASNPSLSSSYSQALMM